MQVEISKDRSEIKIITAIVDDSLHQAEMGYRLKAWVRKNIDNIYKQVVDICMKEGYIPEIHKYNLGRLREILLNHTYTISREIKVEDKVLTFTLSF